jgi:hypothetical protein
MVMKLPLALFALLVLPSARAGAGAPARMYPLTVLSDNPSAYWRLSELSGNIAHDVAGGHDCLLTNVQLGAAGYSAVDPDTSAAFGILTTANSFAGELDKSGNGIPNLNFAQPLGSNAEFSVEAWVKGSPQKLDAGIIAKGYGNGGEQFSLDTGSDAVAAHGFRFSIHDAGGVSHSAASTVVPDGQWYHLVGVCDEPQGWVHLYIDGVHNAKGTISPGAGVLVASGASAPGAAVVSIGARTSGQTATSFDNQFVGTIDEVAVYGYALGAAQVIAHYQAGLMALRFTNAMVRGNNLILSGSGGISNGLYTLAASTNIALALTNWTGIATNFCDGNGRFSLTNPINASAPRQFYALQTAPASETLWIPPEGAWLGAEVTNNVNGITTTQALTHHEASIGRQLDILRFYHAPGGWTALTATEMNYINASRRVFVSFKPDAYWSNAVGVANGGSAAVDAQLSVLAQSVASVKPRKLMVCVWHEPENDLGVAGTTNQYAAMWHNVRSLFDTHGATNVIWCWVIINSGPFYRNLLPGLWPGNSYVDWIGWDVYQAAGNEDYVARQLSAYNYLVNNSDATRSYTAKPWAWTEWGVGSQGWVPTAADQANTINAINAALNSRLFPRVRYVAYFDNSGGPNGTATSAILPGTWGAYSNLANSPYLNQSGAH